MGPKPKKKDELASKTQIFSEVEKAMYELQITDLNRKLARLRAATTDYELRNEELQKAYDKLDEDRADIIAYMKKTLNAKNEENIELKERVKGLEELREVETAEFKDKVTELEKNFTTMKDQLTSENKLLAGKLNTLEEFRAIRDDLMKKYEKQEQNFADQEMKYKRIIYDAEKKFVIGKDKLKKEMEGRLLALAQDFQDASETRIAASTHRVIRENIALNNQLDNLLYTQVKVAEQNDKFKEDERAARIAQEVAEAERDKAINKSVVQLKVINQLTTAFQTAEKNKAAYERNIYDMENLKEKERKLTKENESMALKIRILEQNLHAGLGEQNKYDVEKSKLLSECNKYKKVIKETKQAIQAALKLDQWDMVDPRREVLDRKVILNNILSVISKYTQPVGAVSTESLISLKKVYEIGDLGFVPKPKQSSVKRPTISVSTLLSQKSGLDEAQTEMYASIPSFDSLKSVPSISIIPVAEECSTISKESIPSFTVTSLHSSISTEAITPESSLEALSDVAKQLAASRIEIQKSILKDLALSQANIRITSDTDIIDQSRPRLSKIDLKNVTFQQRKLSQESFNSEMEAIEKVEDRKTNEAIDDTVIGEVIDNKPTINDTVEVVSENDAENKPIDFEENKDTSEIAEEKTENEN